MGGYRARKSYDKEFKLEAVRLVLEEDLSATSVAYDLGISPGVVARWVRKYNADPQHPLPGKGQLKPPERKLQRVKQERDIILPNDIAVTL